MKINAKLPVFIENAMVPRYKSLRPVMQVFDTVVDIAEYSDAELPIALRTHTIMASRRPGLFTEFRHRNGKFYRPVDDDGQWLTWVLANPFNRVGDIGKALYAQAAKAGNSARKTLPEGIVKDILSLHDAIFDYDDFYQGTGRSIVIQTSADEGIAEARDAYHRACETFILIDGKVWQECPEPVLSVDVKNRPGCIRCLAPSMPTKAPIFWETQRPSLGEVLFPVAAYEEARELSDRSFDSTMPWRSRDFKFDLRTPEVFSTELPMSDVVGQLEHCSRLLHLPEPLRNRLLVFLSNDGNWTEELLHDEVNHVLSSVPENQRWMVRALEHQQVRFEARTVHVPIAKSPTP
ncbi:hypothetical protein O9X98_05970 [Agrobacterium salinitolerans]|nr:hypothetical protein [Agrobacterium salinitolerans]